MPVRASRRLTTNRRRCGRISRLTPVRVGCACSGLGGGCDDLRELGDEAVELVVGVVVVHRRARDGVEAAALEVGAREVDRRHADVDGPRPQRGRDRERVDAVDREGHDPAALARPLRDRAAPGRAPRRAARAATSRAQSTRAAIASSPHCERLVDRGAEPEPTGDRVLERLEAAGVVAHLERVGAGPAAGVHVDERRVEPLDPLAAHVQQAVAAGRTQVLAPARRQDVAPERLDVDRELADGLARVEQVRHAGVARRGADGRRRVHQPALRRDPRDGDQPHPAAPSDGRAGRAARRPTPRRARRPGCARR